jgi:hypothetical protein
VEGGGGAGVGTTEKPQAKSERVPNGNLNQESIQDCVAP